MTEISMVYPPTTTTGREETPWIDAWIRWERNSKDVLDADLKDDEPTTPIPTNTFCYSYRCPATNTTSSTLSGNPRHNDKEVGSIDMELRGFPIESEAIWNSTGLTIWKSSTVLCNYLVDHADQLFSAPTSNATVPLVRILELGSGLGRCGILAYKLLLRHASKTSNQLSQPQARRRHGHDHDPQMQGIGSSRVILTDGDTDTLHILRQNLTHNHVVMTGNYKDGKHDATCVTASCLQLLWDASHAQSFCDTHGRFNILLGSDLVYVPTVIGPLFETVSTLLAPQTGVFIMAHCSRREGSSVTLDMVLEGAHRLRLVHEIVEKHDDISLLAFRWSK